MLTEAERDRAYLFAAIASLGVVLPVLLMIALFVWAHLIGPAFASVISESCGCAVNNFTLERY